MSDTKPSRGAKLVTFEQLSRIKAPSPEGRWHPIDHAAVLGIAEGALSAGGYRVASRELYVHRASDVRFVAILDLDAQTADRASLVVGITNSTDQSLSYGFFAGCRSEVTGCVSFRSDLSVKRKHTLAGEGRFTAEVSTAVKKLPAFWEGESARIAHMGMTEAAPRVGDSIILRAFERGIIRPRGLLHAVRAWRKPPHEEFAAPTFWSIANVLSAVIARYGKQDVLRWHVKATMQLNALLDSEPELRAAGEVPLL